MTMISPRGDSDSAADDLRAEIPGQDEIGSATSPTVAPGRRDGKMTFRGVLGDAANWKDIRRSPYGLTPVLVFSALTFFQTFDSAIFSAAAPEIRRDLEINVSSITAAVSTVGVVGVFGLIAIGYFADRRRRLPMVAVGTIISGIFSFLSGRANGIVQLGTAKVLDDVSEQVSAVPRFSLLADYYPPEVRGKAFAASASLQRIAPILAPVVVGFLITVGTWRLPFTVFSIPLVLIGILCLVKLREPVRGYMERRALGASEDVARVEEEPVSLGEAWRTVWGIRTVRRLFIAASLGSGGTLIFGQFFGFFLAEQYGLNAFERGIIGSFSGVFALVGAFLGGGIVDSLTVRRPSRVLVFDGVVGVIGAFACILVALGLPLPILVMLFCAFGFVGGITAPAQAAVFSQIFPAHVRNVGSTVLGLSFLPGYALFLPIGGQIADENGLSQALLYACPFLIIGAIVSLSAASFFEGDMRSSFAQALAGNDWREAKEAGAGKLLVCRDVDVEYDGGVQVLFGVDFDVEEGEIIALLGTNGAGKSTLLRAISGTQEASGGAIVFDGRDITHMPPHEIAQRRVIHMPGGRGVFPGLTVRENLLLGLWMTDGQEEANGRLNEVFEIFPNLKERLDTEASSLSGGEQQQLSLAQAFMGNPKLLLIDELSLGLSPAVVGQLLDIVREIHRRGTTIVIVEQSVNVALTIADKAIFMEKGQVKFVGKTEELLRRSDILRAVYVKGTGSLTDGAPSSALRTERERRALDIAEARPVLEVRNLVKRYGGVTAVDDVSFVLREGESLGLIGPNGSGKTTTFDLISGYQIPDSGEILFEGVDISKLGPEQRAHQKLVRRFQDARLFPSLTVFETILVSLEQRLEVRSTLLHAAGLPGARRAERRARVRAERLIELLDLGSYRDKFVKELSTGLRRIVDLACVLGSEPKVLLLDEPSSGIAQAEAEGLGPLLRRIRFETGCSLLIIEHDMPLISTVADELIALERGSVVVRGTPDVVLNDERVIESYLGGSEAAIRRSGVNPS